MKWKIALVLIAWAVTSYVKSTVAPMVTADVAVNQLLDSDVAYAQFKGVQGAMDYLWLGYILPLAVFIPNIKKLIKGEK